MDNFKITIVVFMALFFIGIGIHLIYPADYNNITNIREANDEEVNEEEENQDSGLDIPEDYEHEVTIFWFWGVTCPVCSRQKSYLDRWEKHEAVEIKRFEIENNRENRQLLIAIAQAYELDRVAVPLTFIGEDYWVGFDERLVEALEEAIVDCTTAEEECPLPTDKVSPLRLP